MRDRATWVLRVLWFLLPLTAGSVLSDAMADSGAAMRATVFVGSWVIWGLVLLALAVPTPVSLTAIRLLAPVAVAATLWSLLQIDAAALGIVAVVHALIALAIAMNAFVGDRFVDGASYGDERRMLLRPPTQIAVLLAPLAWVAFAAGLLGGPLLIADGRLALGLVALVVGLPVAAVAVRAVHELTRRWIVFVPTGFVLHDLQVLTEPVLFRRTAIERLGPAITGTPAVDLSQRAAGLLIETELTDPAPLGLRRGRQQAEQADVRRFLFVPSRPGELLDEAERRRIAVAT